MQCLILIQCNEPRSEDAPAADITLCNPTALGKKGLEAGQNNFLSDMFVNFLFSN